MSKYADIIERLEKATDGSDADLDHLIMAFDPGPRMMPWHYASSIDAAISLVERMLPGWWWMVTKAGECELVSDGFDIMESAATPPLSVLVALFRALEEKEAKDE